MMATDRIDVIDLARELIRAPSPNPPGDERHVAEVARGAIATLGLPPAETFARSYRRPNLVLSADFGTGGRHLLLCGHVDTKPLGDATWTVDPFDHPVVNDRLYGLGSGDMKAAVAAMLVAVQRLLRNPPSRGRVSVVLTADEEDGAYYGAQHIAHSVPLDADGILIAEPGGIESDFDRLHLVSRGIARLRISTVARQGHSSLSGRPGVRNAGVDIARAVTAVADDLELSIPPNHDALDGWEVTVNPGLYYRGGVGYGVLPGRMSVETEVRLLPGMHHADLEKSFRRLADRVAVETGADVRLEWDARDWLPATQVPADHVLARSAQEGCRDVLGTTPPLSVFPGTTDATWFDSVPGIPTLPALGPGLLSRAHGADEWVSVAAVRRSVALYESIAHRFCADEVTIS
ncbi:MAG: M20 family metallopeptidase [Nocardioidaceae bacterium]